MKIQFNWTAEREAGSDLYRLALRVVNLFHCGSLMAEEAGAELAEKLGHSGMIACPSESGVFGDVELYKGE